MLTKYKGILLNSKVYKDNDLLIKFLSNSDEVISGIVYGGLSKKKRNIYQTGFFLEFEIFQKFNKPNYINAELIKPYISVIIENKYKINCLLSITSLINLSIIEGQKVNNIYKTVYDFLIIMIKNKKWFKHYCFFLFQLLKILGYEIDFVKNNQYKYFNLKTMEFSNLKSYDTIEYPFNIFNNDNNINIISVKNLFEIFESVITKYHLSNYNLRLPNQYHLFKKLILKELNKYE